jgi:hypothetical protein
MKKVAIRKLNRTQLRKAATKETYITGKILLDFFGYDSIDQLVTSRRDPASKKAFFQKQEYYRTSTPEPFMLSVTKENNEVRLTGFSDHLPKDVTEVDYVVLEAIKAADGSVVYLFDTIKHPNIVVLASFSADDDADNYNKTYSPKGTIQFSLMPNATAKLNNAYWFWDDNCQDTVRSEIIGKPIEAYFSFRGTVTKRTVRIVPANATFPKLLKAMSNTNNTVETQEKELYFIEEQLDGAWQKLTSASSSLLEITYVGTHLIVSDRETNSFVCYGGNTL